MKKNNKAKVDWRDLIIWILFILAIILIVVGILRGDII